jgi:hypothetical protein
MKYSTLLQKRQAILALAQKHGAVNVRIFGSTIRGEETPYSDIDFIVEALPQHSRFFPSGLIVDLESLLECPVDVVEPETLHWSIREQVLKEAIPL